jgi:hypothetical protein
MPRQPESETRTAGEAAKDAMTREYRVEGHSEVALSVFYPLLSSNIGRSIHIKIILNNFLIDLRQTGHNH